MSNLLGFRRRRKTKSGAVAKERLQLVLVHDRSGLTPSQLESLKDELLQVIARYVDIDHEGVEISLAQENRTNRLQADIPIKATTRPRRRETATPAQSALEKK